ncbi:G5 domain-containing protein [Microbacterium hominis]|nr:G5 domain-containing protein [Microbacterium hominis]
MPDIMPGWYQDPSGSEQLRWWDGRQWTAHVAPSTPSTPSTAGVRRTMRPWMWILIGLGMLLVSVFLAPLAALISLAVLVTAIVGLSRGSRTWLRLRSRRAAVGAAAGAALVLVLSGAVNAAGTLNAPPQHIDSGAHGFVAVTPSRSAGTATSTPTPTPTAIVREEVVEEAIPFDRASIEDANIARGQTAITTTGQDGKRTLTYRVTSVDGVETARELVSDVVTLAAVTEVTVVGTYDPPPPPPAAAASDCDPNYADACVPIASDVDCAWGSGNGPAYFDGVARVVGRDVYDLDRDGDGLACER